jgi:hypothetical protein
MRPRQRYLILGFALTLLPVGVITSSPAAADCSGAGYATVCAQGEVRGGGPTPPSVVYPSYCADPWYCDDGWNVDIDWNPGRPGGGGGPIFPGSGGGPRR